MEFPKPDKRWVNKKYRSDVASQWCCVCGQGNSEPHHYMGLHDGPVEHRGMGRKVSDYLCVPLCRDCHAAIHNRVGERWEKLDATMADVDFLKIIIRQMGKWIREH